MAECMTKGAKDLLVDAITQDAKKEWLLGLMNYIPVCSEAGVVGLAASAGMLEVHKPMRKAPELWNIKVDHTNEKGVTAPFDSPSKLLSFLNLKLSQTQSKYAGESLPKVAKFYGTDLTICDREKCDAASVADIFRLNGFVVECQTDEAGKIVLTMECEKGPPAGHGVAMHVIHPYAFEPLKK